MNQEELEEKISKYQINKTRDIEFVYAIEIGFEIPQELAKTLVDEKRWKKEIEPYELANRPISYQVEIDNDYGSYGGDCNCSLSQRLIITVTDPKTEKELKEEVAYKDQELQTEKKRIARLAKARAEKKKQTEKAELELLSTLAAKHGKKLS